MINFSKKQLNNMVNLIQVNEIGDLVKKLATGQLLWNDATAKYPKFEHQESLSKD